MNAEHQSLQRYSRHYLLPEIGFEGQDRLRRSSALIIGMGGIGCPAALYLAASGIGKLILVDHDQVDLTNLQRQILYREGDIGTEKVIAAKQRLHEINPEVSIDIYRERADENLLNTLLPKVDIVLDATDRFATRHLINRQALSHRKALVMASALRFDGQIMLINPQVETSPCYHCIFPEAEGADETSCALMGVFAPITGLIGAWQAMIALQYVAGLMPDAHMLTLFNGLSGAVRTIRVERNPACPLHP